jgi:hypothetical protein
MQFQTARRRELISQLALLLSYLNFVQNNYAFGVRKWFHHSRFISFQLKSALSVTVQTEKGEGGEQNVQDTSEDHRTENQVVIIQHHCLTSQGGCILSFLPAFPHCSCLPDWQQGEQIDVLKL